MWSERTFCQCFFNKETRKFIDKCMFCTNSSGVMSTCPTATDKHNTYKIKRNVIKLFADGRSRFKSIARERTFFIWNLMVALTSSILPTIDSWWDNNPGNLPALFKPGPSRRGICLINDSLAKNASYFLAVKRK